ncbi:ATP-binding protein [Acidaminococcus fermentans]|uniref:sensor histidine kinase n=1 Tax=Acidaminococcus fermentans TaxID=905 RepID=UPI002E75D2F7|nr:ATP-binding protein [Acidaminococcus fermentans]MEE1599235.1 ATP-binding protein [Acidaminococcus fermentans]MEE4123497.1 ATP-binding protein [Acidaminococcus fermentans]
MRFHSVRNKMMVSTFLLILVCALIVISICSQQMETHFFQYLQDPSALAGQQGAGVYGQGMGRGMMGGGMGMGGMHHRMMLGAAERTFVESYHQSLWWIGFLFAGVGLVVSYFLSGNITRPLRQLSQAAEKIRQGDLKQEVPVDTQDEVGQLAEVFNQMSAELAANESNRQELLANIAHELKTPLAVLQGHLESMLDGVEEPAPDKLFSMQEEVMRLTRLVGDLRDLSLAQVHRLELHLQPVDLDEKVERAADMLEPLLEEKKLRFVKELAPGLPARQLDPDRLNQILYNLITNAIRYTHPGTPILLKTEPAGDRVRLTIADEGPGIAPEDLPHVFEQFYRGDKSRNRASGGSGIGLSLAKSFVEAQGGTITARNRKEGGAEFVVEL